MVRVIRRSMIPGVDSRHDGAERWVVERDLRPGVIEFVICATRDEAEAELGDEVDERTPWQLRTRPEPSAGWRL